MCRVTSPSKSSPEEDTLSPILSFWLRIYRATPKVYIPFTRVNVGFTIACFVFLLIIRLLADRLFEDYFGWPHDSKRKMDAAASLASIIHGLLLVPSLAVLLWSHKYSPSARIDSTPRWYQDVSSALIQLCTAYMMEDVFGMLVLDNWMPGQGVVLKDGDWVYIAHHFATSLYMTSCLAIGAGHMSAMILMLTGEITNPIANTLQITKYAIQLTSDDAFWHVVHPYVEYAYAVFYSIFRAVVGPAFIVHLTYDIVFTKQGRQNIPILLSLFVWMPMVWGVILGSIPWTQEAFDMLRDGVHTVKYHKDYDYGPRYEL